jgi:hypothetical protein
MLRGDTTPTPTCSWLSRCSRSSRGHGGWVILCVRMEACPEVMGTRELVWMDKRRLPRAPSDRPPKFSWKRCICPGKYSRMAQLGPRSQIPADSGPPAINSNWTHIINHFCLNSQGLCWCWEKRWARQLILPLWDNPAQARETDTFPVG